VKYSEGPWYIPLLFMAAFLVAVLTIPTATGHGVNHMIHSGVTVIQGAFGSNGEDKPATTQLRITLPSPQDGPPGTWGQP
jgi:hypothetical protein